MAVVQDEPNASFVFWLLVLLVVCFVEREVLFSIVRCLLTLEFHSLQFKRAHMLLNVCPRLPTSQNS